MSQLQMWYLQVKSNDLESGTVVYNPAAIAAGDMVVFVDRPAARDERSSSTFLSTYETVSTIHSKVCCM